MILATPPTIVPLDAIGTLPEPSGNVAEAGRVAREYVARVKSELRARHVAPVLLLDRLEELPANLADAFDLVQ